MGRRNPRAATVVDRHGDGHRFAVAQLGCSVRPSGARSPVPLRARSALRFPLTRPQCHAGGRAANPILARKPNPAGGVPPS